MFPLRTYDLDSLPVKSISSTTSKGNQRKWIVANTWFKRDELGYEGVAEFLSSLVLSCSTLPSHSYVIYEPCNIRYRGHTFTGCLSPDFRGSLYEKSLGRLFEEHYIDIVSELEGLTIENGLLKLTQLVYKVTGLNIEQELRLIFTFDSLILNEDRHINNISFLSDGSTWRLAPIFDNGLSLLSDYRDYPKGTKPKVLMNKVRPRLLTRDFNKHSKLYKGQPFINKKALWELLEQYDELLGRAGTVLRIQINSGKFDHIFF